MGTVIRWFGIVAGALSLALLIKQGLDLGFVAPLQSMLDYYHSWIDFLLGWAEPFIREGFQYFRDALGWNLELAPHWKHVFVLVWLYLSSRARSTFLQRNYVTAAFMISIGFVASFLGAVLAGTTPPVGSDGTGVQANLLLAIYPVVAIFLFDLSEVTWTSILRLADQRVLERDETLTSWQAFSRLVPKALSRFLFGAMVVAVSIIGADELPWLRQFSNPGLMLLGVLLVAIAAYWLYQGRNAANGRRKAGEDWWTVYWRVGATQVGVLMLYTMGAALAFIAINAGLKLAGIE